MLNTRISNNRLQPNKDSTDENTSKIDLKDEKVVNRILEGNNQVRKKISQGENGLFKAFSSYLYFTSSYSEKLKSILCEKLREMIAENKLPAKLNSFQNNYALYDVYKTNPYFQGFEKINLELLSHIFKVRIIVYWISQDYYIQSLIISNKFTRTVELLRTGTTYDLIYSNTKFETLKFCQNMIYEILNHKLQIENNHMGYKNLEFEEPKEENKEEVKLKSRHKKSFSADTFNILDNQGKFYDNFKSMKPPEDFIKLLKEGPSRNLAVMDNFNIHPMEFNASSMGTSTPNRNKKLSFFPNLAKINETGLNVFNLQNEKSKPKFSISDLPNPNVLMTENLETSGNINENVTNIFPEDLQEFIMNKKENQVNKKPIILDESNVRYAGTLKFFDENKNYGFIIMDNDQSDIFVHYDDLLKANITKEFLKSAKHGNMIRFSFSCMSYIGKYNKSRKAVEVQYLENNSIYP